MIDGPDFPEAVFLLKSTPLQIKAYEHLRELIDNDMLVDGVIYSETKIATQIGVSRTPMRDALQRLEQEGFIEILPSRGFQLRPITRERIEKNNQVRNALEGYSALSLTQNRHTLKSQAVIRHLGELLEQQKKVCAEHGELAEFIRYDSEFHLALVASLENEELLKIFFSHLYYIQKLARKSLMRPGCLEATIEEHTAIYDAIRMGDVANVYNITMQHMQAAAAINLAELEDR